ncbi:MAG TPA: trypsin-like peptidase domain-containing protein [Kribbella sp.]
MEDGRNALPRPPRRIPAGAGSLTQLEAPSRPSGAQSAGRRPWIFGRILAGFIVLLVIVAAGAGAGWYVRAQRVQIDTTKVQDAVGPAVVRVLSTTCAGSGEASGVLVDGGLVLTAASGVRQSLSTVIVTSKGLVRRANVIGTSQDGVAVLQLIGELAVTPAEVARSDPDPKAERALIGYTAAGIQTVNEVGSAAQPRALGEVMNAAKLGGPVVDSSNRIVGLVVGDTVQASTIVPRAALRGYVAPNPAGITAEANACTTTSRGPQTPIAPVLQVARTPLAVEVQKLMASYLTLENKRDFAALQGLYSRQLAKSLTEARDAHSHQTTYFFGPKLTEVSATADGGAYARITFNALFSPTAKGAEGRNCNRLDYRYRLVREGGKLVIETVKAMINPPVSCDSD